MNIFKEVKIYALDYLVLVLLLVGFIAGFFYVWPNTILQRSLIGGLSLMYFCWGLLHHARADHINTRVVLEYFFASALAGTILLFITA